MYIAAAIVRFLLFIFRPRPRYRPHQLAYVQVGPLFPHVPDRMLLIEARRWNYRYAYWVYDGPELHANGRGYATTATGAPEEYLYDIPGLDYKRPFPILRDSLVTS